MKLFHIIIEITRVCDPPHVLQVWMKSKVSRGSAQSDRDSHINRHLTVVSASEHKKYQSGQSVTCVGLNVT